MASRRCITMPGVSRAQADQMAAQAVGWCIQGIRE
jgi:hypothetical protein